MLRWASGGCAQHVFTNTVAACGVHAASRPTHGCSQLQSSYQPVTPHKMPASRERLRLSKPNKLPGPLHGPVCWVHLPASTCMYTCLEDIFNIQIWAMILCI